MDKMKHLFSKYIHSVCSPGEFREITEWLSDRGHEEAVGKVMEETWLEQSREEERGEAVEQGPRQGEVWARVRLEINRKTTARVKRQLTFFRWGFAAAATLAVALVTAHFLFREVPVQHREMVQTQSVTVPHGARTSFLMPDGSMVWLNSGSTLTYASDFNQKNRNLELEGEAYFEVVKGEYPFMIHTALGKVEVTGTCLNVKSCPQENRFETTVERGSVNVHCDQLKEICRLEPGQQIRLSDGKWELLKVETDLFTSWKDGKIIFRKEYLPEVARRLERWYNVKIELDKDPRLNKIHYTGTLEMESFSEVLELLKITASINYSYNDKTRVIRITHR